MSALTASALAVAGAALGAGCFGVVLLIVLAVQGRAPH